MLQKFAVIGHPIGHTMSPFIHNSLFAINGVEVEYQTLDISPEKLSDEIGGILAPLTGFNVTIPHKENIIPLLDYIDDSAKKYNPIIRNKSKYSALVISSPKPQKIVPIMHETTAHNKEYIITADTPVINFEK